MASLGVLGLYRGKPLHPVGDDGRMALSDHFRELRARLLRSVTVVILAMIVALVFYQQLFAVIIHPYNVAKDMLPNNIKTEATISGVGGALSVQLKIAGLAALIGTAPYWLYQIWAFILPGLHPRERKWTRIFVAVAGPLFLAGAALGYWILPKGIKVLIGFTPEGSTNLIDLNDFLSFMSRMILIFGIAMEIPLFVVLLNLVGVIKGRHLARYRPWIILGTFVFAAVATPSTDPISMCLLAAPMLLLFVISEIIARSVDRARGRAAEQDAISADQKSRLPDYEE